MLVGCSDHFQIWDKAAWESRQPAPVTVEEALVRWAYEIPAEFLADPCPAEAGGVRKMTRR